MQAIIECLPKERDSHMPHSKKRQALREAAKNLFYTQGFAAVSVEAICTAAHTSRVTFYKYYSGKNALVQELFAEQKEQVRNRLECLLAQQCSLEEAAAALFAIQRESMTELYSAPVLDDIANVADLELERFFRSMEEEKYQFSTPCNSANSSTTACRPNSSTSSSAKWTASCDNPVSPNSTLPPRNDCRRIYCNSCSTASLAGKQNKPARLNKRLPEIFR